VFNGKSDYLACPDPTKKPAYRLKKLDEDRILELVREYWGTPVKVLEDAYVSFVRRIEREIRDTSS
jgi:surfactin synthase thioesterase subunit